MYKKTRRAVGSPLTIPKAESSVRETGMQAGRQRQAGTQSKVGGGSDVFLSLPFIPLTLAQSEERMRDEDLPSLPKERGLRAKERGREGGTAWGERGSGPKPRRTARQEYPWPRLSLQLVLCASF